MNERRETSRVVCVIHNVEEVAYTDTYRECGECWHVFQTEEDLINAALAVGYPIHFTSDRPLTGDTIYACPECAHDF